MYKKSGFTLSETLITLVVLGIVSSLTIPTLINDHKNRENVTGYHRAINILNNAYKQYYDSKSNQYSESTGEGGEQVYTLSGDLLDPVSIGETRLNSTNLLMKNLFLKYLSINSTQLTQNTPMAGCGSGVQYFYTADGMRYCFSYSASGSINANYGDYTYGLMWVDINGDRNPNRISQSINNPGDTFPIVIMKNRFIPGHPTDSTKATLAQNIYFGKK